MNRKKIYYTSGIAATAVMMMIANHLIRHPRLNAHVN